MKIDDGFGITYGDIYTNLKRNGFVGLRETTIDGEKQYDEWIAYNKPANNMVTIVYINTKYCVYDMFITTFEEFNKAPDNYYEDLNCVLLHSNSLDSLVFDAGRIYGMDYSNKSKEMRFIISENRPRKLRPNIPINLSSIPPMYGYTLEESKETKSEDKGDSDEDKSPISIDDIDKMTK